MNSTKNTMNKVWFITGAGSGLGTGIAKAALSAGDRVVATGRNIEKVRNAFPHVAPENIAFVQLDVINDAQAKAAVDEAMKRFGRIDVLVNNAGYSLLGNFEQMTTAEIQQQFATNFYGVVHVMQAALPVMAKAERSSEERKAASGLFEPTRSILDLSAFAIQWPA